MEFRLYVQEAGGSAFYAESQDVMVDEGIFTAYLGDGTPADLGNGTTSPPLDLATFANRPRGVTFLGITIDEDPEMSPRVQLGSVPFAAFAQTCGDANTVGGKPAAAFQPKTTGMCPTDQAVVGLAGDGSLMCAAHAGPPGPPGKDGESAEAGTTGKIDASQVTGTLKASQIPDLGATYFEKGRFAWGEVKDVAGSRNNSGSVRDPNGVNNDQSGPNRGALKVSVPDIGCNRPLVWVSGGAGGTQNFVVWNLRNGTLYDNSPDFYVNWISLDQVEGYSFSLHWLAYCPPGR